MFTFTEKEVCSAAVETKSLPPSSEANQFVKIEDRKMALDQVKYLFRINVAASSFGPCPFRNENCRKVEESRQSPAKPPNTTLSL